jgi:hypothetical protein
MVGAVNKSPNFMTVAIYNNEGEGVGSYTVAGGTSSAADIETDEIIAALEDALNQANAAKGEKDF